ncbi:uncharacterized protein [Diadema setosum]|uniref:uncharacterized protein n=1 Tax=Diadema setosum TaxID=31175 RepID=UPI003B3A2FE5
MANVFTRRYGKPRTTTFSDFCIKKDHPHTRPKLPRLFSPIRRHNPHSPGLVYQSPYNKDNLTFSIWSPRTIHKDFENKFSHMQETNWTCRHEVRSNNPLEVGKPPKIRYSISSTSRFSYQDPAIRMSKWKTTSRPTMPNRFSSNPNTEPVAGIVPNANILPPLPAKDEKKMPAHPIKVLNELLNDDL